MRASLEALSGTDSSAMGAGAAPPLPLRELLEVPPLLVRRPLASAVSW